MSGALREKGAEGPGEVVAAFAPPREGSDNIATDRGSDPGQSPQNLRLSARLARQRGVGVCPEPPAAWKPGGGMLMRLPWGQMPAIGNRVQRSTMRGILIVAEGER
jgi:hypothetical protein